MTVGVGSLADIAIVVFGANAHQPLCFVSMILMLILAEDEENGLITDNANASDKNNLGNPGAKLAGDLGVQNGLRPFAHQIFRTTMKKTREKVAGKERCPYH